MEIFCVFTFASTERARHVNKRTVTTKKNTRNDDETRAVPEAAPQGVHAEAEDSSSIRVTWHPPPEDKQNGHIAYYKLYYAEASRPDSDAVEMMLKGVESGAGGAEFLLEELKKWTQYRIWLLAGTAVGDGPRSHPITVRTQEDGKTPTD